MIYLIIEDDRGVAGFLGRGLKAEGNSVMVVHDGVSGLSYAKEGNYDVIILDLMLPEMHGLELCQELRLSGNLTPVLMLTALDALEDKVEGLRLGADDYLTKPFAFDELLARLNALERRSKNFKITPSVLSVDNLTFDLERLRVQRGDRKISLTAKELAMLELLLSSPGKVFSRERILSNVWGTNTDPLTNVIDVYIAKLRKKIDEGEEKQLIETVRGRGYRIADE